MLYGATMKRTGYIKSETVGNFTFHHTGIEGLVVIEPRVFGDARGFFLETYNSGAFSQVDAFMRGGQRDSEGASIFVQDNHSFSTKGVLRGLHYQSPGWQGKLVRVVRGLAYDVAVDIRRGPTFGDWFGVVLSAEKKNMMFVPEGFAHGFLALDDCEFVYKCTRLYAPGEEGCVRYDDPEIGIDWNVIAAGHGITSFSLSDKDQKTARPLSETGPFEI